jgi:hypothetical protein
MFPDLRRRISPQSTTVDAQKLLPCTGAQFGNDSLLALLIVPLPVPNQLVVARRVAVVSVVRLLGIWCD